MGSPNSTLISITGVGLCSSMGGYHDACAAFRAGLNRFADYHVSVMNVGDDQPEQLTVAPAAGNVFIYQGVARTIKMLELAYVDMLKNRRQPLPVGKILVLMATPDPDDRELDIDSSSDEVSRADRLQSYLDRLTDPLFDKIDPELKSLAIQCVFGERVAFARVLQKAGEVLNSGEAEHCLIMVADSLLNDDMIELQLADNRLKTGENPVGYIPGEGAAVFLVSAAADAQGAVSCRVSVALDASRTDAEDADAVRSLWQGKKLLGVIESLLAKPADQGEDALLPQLMSDINGEEKRAIELGFLHFELKKNYPDARVMEPQIPALGFGETAALAGPLALMNILASVQRHYARHRQFLICLSEDSGKRAAIKVEF